MHGNQESTSETPVLQKQGAQTSRTTDRRVEGAAMCEYEDKQVLWRACASAPLPID